MRPPATTLSNLTRASNVAEPLLQAQDLQLHYPVQEGLWLARKLGVVRAVDGVSLQVQRGETLALVGESGCGKSSCGRALLQLVRPTAGSVHFDGQDITKLWERAFGIGRWRWSPALRQLRRRMQMIFQDPYASLNPRMTVLDIVGEPLTIFGLAKGDALRRRVQDLLTQVGMDPRYMRRYPHAFSGGQRQRIGIARALATSPDLIVADEPISALDVSIQAQILNLLQTLQRELALTYVFVAHDLAAVRHIATRVCVMYLGRIVERAPCDALFAYPAHPYTQALLTAVPSPNPAQARALGTPQVTGDVPSPMQPPTGCAFHPRCPVRIARCSTEVPQLRRIGPDHEVACHVSISRPEEGL